MDDFSPPKMQEKTPGLGPILTYSGGAAKRGNVGNSAVLTSLLMRKVSCPRQGQRDS